MSTRTIGYARCSTGEQDTRAQADALIAAGADRVYTDDGISGTLTSRPALDECLASLERGDVLVVKSLSRLGRTMRHLIDTVYELGERGIVFRSLTEGIDTTSASGRLVLNVFSALASFERELTIERTRDALQAKRRRGEPLGRPFRLKPNQVAAAQEMRAAGHNVRHIAHVFACSSDTIRRRVLHVAQAAGG
jgi:DNA invertase Pin-like site-specific DNA recombinase